MAQRSNYWSCSRFANWIRGSNKLKCGTSDEWDEWHKGSQKARPFRYWLAEEALDAIQNFIWYPVDKIYDIKYYINNRWITRTHSLTAHPRDIKPGSWSDVGNRFLPCLFNELVEYVEIELAWWHIAWGGEDDRKKYGAPFWASGWFRWRTWRSAQAGLDNLEWQRKLVWKEEEMGENHPDVGQPTRQAINAQEILDLYRWWTEVYPKRPDPHEASGWSAYCEKKRQLRDENNDPVPFFSDRGQTQELTEMCNRALDLSIELEEKYRQEDEEMMIRLIRVRDSLWT